MGSQIGKYFGEYLSYHRTRGNIACHWLGIPAIMISVLGILSHLGVGYLNAGTLLWAGSLIWYLTLDWKLGAPFGLVTLGCYFAGTAIPAGGLAILFVGGWIAQLIGHAVFEKKKPAFLTNIQHLLIGPLWLFAKLIQY